MGKFLKWGMVFIIAYALTIAPLFFLSKNNVVGGKSSTTLPYEKENNRSVVILENNVNNVFKLYKIYPKPINIPLYQKILEFKQNAKNYELKRLKEKRKEKLLEIAKLKKKMLDEVKKYKIVVTAYTNRCLGCKGITYTGYNVHHTIRYKGLNIIATDNSIIPLYSIVRIDTNNFSFDAIVLDRGGGIKGNKIDLLVNSYGDAIKFGRQNATLTITGESKQ